MYKKKVKEKTVEAVDTTQNEKAEEKQEETTSIELLSLKKQENRKTYPFTLKPSVRKKSLNSLKRMVTNLHQLLLTFLHSHNSLKTYLFIKLNSS